MAEVGVSSIAVGAGGGGTRRGFLPFERRLGFG